MREVVQSKRLTLKRVFNYFLSVCSSQLNTKLLLAGELGRRDVGSHGGEASARRLANNESYSRRPALFASGGGQPRRAMAGKAALAVGDAMRAKAFLTTYRGCPGDAKAKTGTR